MSTKLGAGSGERHQLCDPLPLFFSEKVLYSNWEPVSIEIFKTIGAVCIVKHIRLHRSEAHPAFRQVLS